MRSGSKHSAESREKMSMSTKGSKNHRFGKSMQEETKRKIALAQMGKKNHNFGKTLPPETKMKISMSLSGEKNPMHGKHRSAEVKEKLSEYRIGRTISKEVREKISFSELGEKNAFYGKHHSTESRMKMSEAKRGSKSVFWQGGISFEPYCPKFNNDLKRRVRDFFENRCVLCGRSRDDCHKELNVHHVEYDKQACCDGKPVHFAALCNKCHCKTNHGREHWEAMLHRIIDEIYGGRSYFTKDEWTRPPKPKKSRAKAAKQAEVLG